MIYTIPGSRLPDDQNAGLNHGQCSQNSDTGNATPMSQEESRAESITLTTAYACSLGVTTRNTVTTTPTSSSIAECDIGKLLDSGIDLRKLSREEKYRILTTDPSLDSSSYPHKRPYASGSFRQFQPEWLRQYPWLHYSRHVDGAFCRACAFFGPEKAGGQSPGQFVSKPLSTWAKKTQAMNSHSASEYHANSLTRMSEFVKRYENPSQTIATQLNTQLQKTIENNTKVIESLLRVVMLCGKQGLALRGHRDDNIVWTNEGEGESDNHGNFIELVRFRAESHEVLRHHLQSAPRNAVYTLKTIQNELVHIIGFRIRGDILREIQEAKYYTVIANEVSDVSNKEHCHTLCPQ